MGFLNFSVGRTKILAGAGIGILGALTGNQGLQQAGGGLVGLGVASSLGAHLLGKKKWTEKILKHSSTKALSIWFWT